MKGANPLPRIGLPRLHEGSGLRSGRDSDVTAKLWQKVLPVDQQLYRACQAIEELQRQLNRLRRRSGGSGEGTGEKDPVWL
jgi:hypothetical protein